MKLPLAVCSDCAERHSRARVWLWLAYWASQEQDAIFYHRDITLASRSGDELDALEAARRRFVEKANEVGGPGYADRGWRSALDAFSQAVATEKRT